MRRPAARPARGEDRTHQLLAAVLVVEEFAAAYSAELLGRRVSPHG